MDGPNIISSGSLGNLGSTLHDTGDFNGDGLADFLFQDSNGEVDVVGTGIIGTVGNPGPSWHVIGTGDYNGDGKSDILFQNSSGEVAIWELDGTNVIGNSSLGNPGPTWHVEPDDGFISRSVRTCLGRPTAVPSCSYKTTTAMRSCGRRTERLSPEAAVWATPDRIGTSKRQATSTATAIPTSCGRTTRVKGLSGN